MDCNISKDGRFVETPESTLSLTFGKLVLSLEQKIKEEQWQALGQSSFSGCDVKLPPFASARHHSLLQEAADRRTKKVLLLTQTLRGFSDWHSNAGLLATFSWKTAYFDECVLLIC